MDRLPKTVEKLLEELQKLPGIGRKSAERMVFYLFTAPGEDVHSLAHALIELKEKVTYCSRCFNLTENDLCDICRNPHRDTTRICVVETPADLIALDKSGAFNGLYHVLMGHLAPMEGITHKDLKIAELEERVKTSEGLQEVIIATTTSLEGETTATFIADRLSPTGISITRIGLGLPAGSSLEYADETTLRKAIESRRSL